MNVLINWQSGADMRLIESVPLSTVSTVWSSQLIFICGKPCHMPLKLLTVNNCDDIAICHAMLMLYL